MHSVMLVLILRFFFHINALNLRLTPNFSIFQEGSDKDRQQ